MKLKNNFSTFTIVFFIAYIGVFYLRSQNESNNFTSVTTTLREQACVGIMGRNGSIASTSEKADAKKFIDSLSKANPSFGVTKLINNKTSIGSDQIQPFIRVSGIWVIFLIFSLFGWFCYCLCCCCDSCCPPCKRCKRDLEEKPYKKSEVVVPGGFAVLMSLLIIGTSIAGLVYAPGVEHGIRAMRCSLMAALEDVITESPSFVGIEGIQAKLTTLNNRLTDFTTSTTNLFGTKRSDQILQLQAQVFDPTIFPTYDTTKTATLSYVYNNFLMTYIYYGLDSTYSIQPLVTYFSGQSTPVDVLNLVVPNEKEIIDLYYNGIILSMQGLETAAEPFAQSSFASTMASGVTQTQTLVNQADTKAKDLDSSTSSMGDYGKIVTSALQGLFGGSLFMAFLIVLGTLIVGLTKAYKARVLIHIGWCFFCLIMILGFLLGAILNPVSVIAIEACGYLDQFLTNQAFYQSNGIITDPDMKNLLNECFFGAGDLMSSLGIKQQTQDLSTITDKIKTFQNTTTSMKSIDEVNSQLQKNEFFTRGLNNLTYPDKADPSTATLDQATFWLQEDQYQTQILSKNNDASNALQTYITDINNWINQITDIIDLITNNTTGLFANINCNILISVFGGIYDGLCVLFVPAVYRTTILILLISVAMFIGSLASCCLGLRIGKYVPEGSEGLNTVKVHNQDQDVEMSKLNAQT